MYIYTVIFAYIYTDLVLGGRMKQLKKSKAKKPKTDRVQTYTDKQKAKGNAPVYCFVPIAHHQKVLDYASKLRDAAEDDFVMVPEITIPPGKLEKMQEKADAEVQEGLFLLGQILKNGNSKTFSRLNRALRIVHSEAMPKVGI